MIERNQPDELITQLIKGIQEVIGMNPTELHEPRFEGKEEEYLKECLDSTYVSSFGRFVDKFENDLADYVGVKHAISVVNGTSALHIALKLAGVQPGDEVIVQALTFIATANAVSYCGAQPHFVDIDEKTMGIDCKRLREYLIDIVTSESGRSVNRLTGNVIRAMVPMHTFGHPSEIEGLLEIAEEFNIVIVEDAAEALGSLYKNQHVGSFGLLSATSFNGNKIITTGGGGAILTNNTSLALQAKHLSTTAKVKHKWEFVHDQVGYNYRMPNINAALGCAQLEQLPNKLARKRNLFEKYKFAIDSIPGVKMFQEPSNCTSNYWLQTIILEQDLVQYHQSIIDLTNQAGISTRPAWKILSELPPYRNSPRMLLACALSLSQRIINIPSSPHLIGAIK